jgi:hypothetical protein
MFDNNAAVHVGTLERVCRELGVELPKPYVAAIADAERVKKTLDGIGGQDTARRLTRAAFDAVLAGADPLTDPDVQKLATLQQLENGGIYPAAEQQRREMISEAVSANANFFTEAWCDSVAGDAELLVATAQSDVFTGVEILHDMRPADLVDAEAHRMWVEAATATRRLDSAASGFGALMAATGLRYRPEHKVMVLGAGITLSDLTTAITERDLLDNRKSADAWRLARAGITPRLHRTLADFMATVTRITSEQNARDEEAQEIIKRSGFNSPTPDQARRYAELMER